MAERVVGGGYRVGLLLARGGMGDVYEAVGPHGEAVALKFLPEWGADDAELVTRFRREARIAARIVSPHVARVLSAGKDRDGRLWIAFERLWGESLDVRLRKLRRLPPHDVAWIVDDALEGLAAAHAVSVVHRDVKPGNLFLESAVQRARLLDFGVSKLRDASIETRSPNLTDKDDTLGTPSFAAPEQIDDPVSADARADLYSLGLVAFVSLAGLFPFAGATTATILHSKRHARAKSLREATGAAWPEAVERYLDTSLAREPGHRMASAEQARALWREAIGEAGWR